MDGFYLSNSVKLLLIQKLTKHMNFDVSASLLALKCTDHKHVEMHHFEDSD